MLRPSDRCIVYALHQTWTFLCLWSLADGNLLCVLKIFVARIRTTLNFSCLASETGLWV